MKLFKTLEFGENGINNYPHCYVEDIDLEIEEIENREFTDAKTFEPCYLTIVSLNCEEYAIYQKQWESYSDLLEDLVQSYIRKYELDKVE